MVRALPLIRESPCEQRSERPVMKTIVCIENGGRIAPRFIVAAPNRLVALFYPCDGRCRRRSATMQLVPFSFIPPACTSTIGSLFQGTRNLTGDRSK